MSNEDRPESTVTPDEVGAAAVAFMDGLTAAFGVEGSSTLHIDELELRVDVTGSELGLLVGPAAGPSTRFRTSPGCRRSAASAITRRDCASMWPATASDEKLRCRHSHEMSPNRCGRRERLVRSSR